MESRQLGLPSPAELTGDEREALAENLRGVSTFERRFGPRPHLISYDAGRYAFHERIGALLVEKGIVSTHVPLSRLHSRLSPEDMAVDESQVNRVTAAFYETDEVFRETYRSFVREVIAEETLNTDVWFQATPTIRFHFPKARGMDRDDRVHNDIMLGHPPQEINVWVPLTDAGRSQSFALSDLRATRGVLSRFGYDLPALQNALRGDAAVHRVCRDACETVESRHGQAVMFDSRCLHTARANESEVTRVSFDFRVVPVDDLTKMPYEFRGTGRRRALFAPGDYYAAQTVQDRS